jgi:hypothetical protein
MPPFRRALFVAGLVFGISASPLGSYAQTPPPAAAGMVILSIIDVKPDLMSEFGALQGEVMAAQRAGGQPWRETWHTATFGLPFRVGVLSPVESLGQLDGQTYTAKGVGATAATALNQRARGMIEQQQIYLLRLRPDLSIGARPAKTTLAVLSYLSVAPGREPDFERVLKADVHSGLRKAGVEYYGVSRVVYGGDTSQYLTLLMFKDFSDLDRGHPLERALGADGLAKLEAKLAGIVTRLERHVVRLNEALSFRQAVPQR